jgi:acetoin utilization deacetylase AcuC-like enzyme
MTEATTAVFFSPVYFRHNTGKRHPESARRLQAIIKELEESKRAKDTKWQFVGPTKASTEIVGRVHDLEYVNYIQSFCKAGGGLLDEDTVASRESYETALYAVGGCVNAVDLVIKGCYQNAFALVRPPGHHASRSNAKGFCIFNNVAAAAKNLVEHHDLKRVLILDIDAHSGDGTQGIFYNTNKVLYISLHEDPTGFPGAGFLDETGRGDGLGYNVNIPLPFKTTDSTYLTAIERIVEPIASEYSPEFILLSAGFDGHYSDPIGNLALTSKCYRKLFAFVKEFAADNCHGKLVAVLEGGYNINYVGKLAAQAVGSLSGTHCIFQDALPAAGQRPTKQAEKILVNVKKAQKAFWHLD